MCGIIAVVRRRSDRPVPGAAELHDLVGPVLEALDALDLAADPRATLASSADRLEAANALLLGVPGVQALLADAALATWLDASMGTVGAALDDLEARLDTTVTLDGRRLEDVNASLVRLRDAAWSIGRDRLRAAREVAAFAGPGPSLGAIEAFLSVQQALSALDRLEVRGRDSAGLHLFVSDHGLDLDSPSVAAAVAERSRDPLFGDGSVRVAGGQLGFVYKAAAEIGELGDNTAALRAAITSDQLLARALAGDEVRTVVLGHTRWASVGIISEPNAHPLNSEEEDRPDAPYCLAVLNGDVDNYADLIATEGLGIAEAITTDAKVIPTLTSRYLVEGDDVAEAFRRTVACLEGSVAIASSTAVSGGALHLALRGSGQALYVGLADDAYIVASEPYGVVEETSRYLRMDGETPGNPDNPNASRGQIITLDPSAAGSVEGISRAAYDGTPLPVAEDEISVAQITTRDIDRGDAPHYLLKEITESPASFRKTLRGKLVERDGRLEVVLGDDTLPPELRHRLASGQVRSILVIGQGTAAVAGQSLAAMLDDELAGRGIRAQALPATELSGFGMRPDMSDTLVVAISQSGTTTDTNRTVDLVRGRGAMVVAIVNRRNSDLTDKSDGVLYTSDGRDVEMSVASTKAFYSQIAAGLLLAIAIADEIGSGRAGAERQELLASIRELPRAMSAVVERRPDIADAARRFAPARRYWAVVGNGVNVVAARELRIKLSELCYKSIAADVTEDKKHIDLSAEPMILVCAAGLSGSTADDVAKEVAIYRAHKAAPIVIADEEERRFAAALDVLTVPSVHSRLSFVLSTVVGHLFGYEAARAIDAQAQPLRASRSAIEQLAAEGASGAVGHDPLTPLRPTLERQAGEFFDALRSGMLNGNLEASTSVRLSSLYRYALGVFPLDAYQAEFGKVGTPSVVLEDLAAALTVAIEELTRPIDAIKHQAKTVTVGISRSDETLLQVPLARAVLDAGAARDRLSYSSLRTLADLDPAVAEVLGSTRYRIEGEVDVDDGATIVVVDRSGIAARIPSRTDRDARLRGTKHRVALERQLLVARGRNDGRTIVIVPEVKDAEATGLTLLHVRFHDHLPAHAARSVLQGYRNRFSQMRDAVMETEPTFRDDLLAEQPVADLLTLSIPELADRWR